MREMEDVKTEEEEERCGLSLDLIAEEEDPDIVVEQGSPSPRRQVVNEELLAPKSKRGKEVLCICCNHGTVARCVNCFCGFEQLNYNEEHLLYKNVIRLVLLGLFSTYCFQTRATSAPPQGFVDEWTVHTGTTWRRSDGACTRRRRIGCGTLTCS